MLINVIFHGIFHEIGFRTLESTGKKVTQINNR